jgi:hypothetical protein
MSLHDEMELRADLYAAGGLGPDERREVDEHASACTPCASMIREAADFRRFVTGALAPDAPPADLEDRLIARLRAKKVLKTKRWRFLPGKRFLKGAGGLAAAAGLVFLGNAFSQGAGNATHLISQLDQAAETYQTDDGVDILNRANADLEGVSVPMHREAKGFRQTLNARTGLIPSVPPPDLRIDGAYSGRHDAARTWAYGGAPTTDSLSHTGWNGAAFKERLEDSTKLAFAEGDKDGHSYRLEDAKKAKEQRGESERLSKRPSENDAKTARINDLQRQLDFAGSELTKNEADMQVFVRQQQGELARRQDLATKASGTGGRMNDFPGVDIPKPLPAVPDPSAKEPAVSFPDAAKAEIAQENRKIIRTADVDLEVDSYDATSTKLTEMVQAEKGFVANAHVQKLPNGKIRASVTVRIPPDRFEAVIAKLKDMGTVRNQNVGSQDISKAYLDLEMRRDAKQSLLDRLKLLLKDAKGTVKELLEVEVQMGKTIEEIESIKGELKFYDNQVGLSTLILNVSEKDLGLPFEYVQSLQSNLGLTARDADDAYAKAQKEITDAGGQIVDSKMNRQSDGSATGTIRARVDAAAFPALREALKKLGRVTNDTLNQQKTAHGGQELAPKPDAPVKKEQAVIDLSITTPPLVVTRRAALLVENTSVQDAYPAARRTVEAAGGKVTSGSLMGRDTSAQASLTAEIDADRFTALVDSLKTAGRVKDSRVRLDLPAATPDGQPALLRERAEIELTLVSPPQLIDDEHGIGKTVRDTFTGSWKGILWSVERLFVGLSLAGPWLGVALLGWLGWRRLRRKKPAAG